MNKITVVTAWYHINNKYSLSQYIEWFKRFLSLNINLIIYTNEESKKQIEHLRSEEKENTIYIIRDFKDFKVYQFLNYWEYCEQIDIEKRWGAGHNKYLYMIWNERHYYWIKEVTEYNPFKSEYFIWADIGIIREPEMMNLLKGFPNGILKYPKNKFILSQVGPLEQGDNLMDSDGILLRNKNLNVNTSCQPYNRVQGGFFAGSLKSCDIYCDMYQKELHRFIQTKNFAGKDQNILFNLVLQNKESNFIKLLPPDYESWKPNHWAACMVNMSRVPLFTSLIQGGLGNQMFQVAVTFAAALSIGGKAIFKNEKLSVIGNTDRPTYWDSVFRKCWSSTDDLKESFIDLHEYHNHHFTPVIDSARNILINCGNSNLKNFRFVGYFQCSRYFNQFKNEIKSLFEPSKNVNNWCNNWLQQKEIQHYFKVAIHVRRGDYIKLNWNLPINYYNKCIELVENKMIEKEVKFIVFSDDLNWCKENFNNSNKFIFCEEGTDVEQMYLIGKMDGMICSNSSYSWWSSYLSDTHSIVTVPNRWFLTENYNPEIMEPTWIKIEY
jgi:hypothetical protein